MMSNIKGMVMVLLLGKMEVNILGIGSLISQMVMEKRFIPMVVFMMVIG